MGLRADDVQSFGVHKPQSLSSEIIGKDASKLKRDRDSIGSPRSLLHTLPIDRLEEGIARFCK